MSVVCGWGVSGADQVLCSGINGGAELSVSVVWLRCFWWGWDVCGLAEVFGLRSQCWGSVVSGGAEVSVVELKCQLWGWGVSCAAEVSVLGLRCQFWGWGVSCGAEVSAVGLRCQLWGRGISCGAEVSVVGPRCQLWGWGVSCGAEVSEASPPDAGEELLLHHQVLQDDWCRASASHERAPYHKQ